MCRGGLISNLFSKYNAYYKNFLSVIFSKNKKIKTKKWKIEILCTFITFFTVQTMYKISSNQIKCIRFWFETTKYTGYKMKNFPTFTKLSVCSVQSRDKKKKKKFKRNRKLLNKKNEISSKMIAVLLNLWWYVIYFDDVLFFFAWIPYYFSYIHLIKLLRNFYFFLLFIFEAPKIEITLC